MKLKCCIGQKIFLPLPCKQQGVGGSEMDVDVVGGIS